MWVDPIQLVESLPIKTDDSKEKEIIQTAFGLKVQYLRFPRPPASNMPPCPEDNSSQPYPLHEAFP
jgi:hypothetical protein